MHHNPRAFDVGAQDRIGICCPKTIVGRCVHHVANSRHRARDSRCVADVALGDLDIEACQIAASTRRPDECAHRVARVQKRAHNGGSDKTRSPCHQHAPRLAHQCCGMTQPSITARCTAVPGAGTSVELKERLSVVPWGDVASITVRPPW